MKTILSILPDNPAKMRYFLYSLQQLVLFVGFLYVATVGGEYQVELLLFLVLCMWLNVLEEQMYELEQQR